MRLSIASNPARDAVTVRWRLDDPGPVELRVFGGRGRLVARLLDGRQPGGPGEVRWGLTDQRGQRLASGVYFLRLDSERGPATGRLVVLR